MKILLSILLVGLFATGGNGQSNSEDQTWVDRLKSTPAARLESGLPKKPFDQWLAELTKTQPKYELSNCHLQPNAAVSKCIIVSAEIASGRRLQLFFAVPQVKAGKSGDTAVCKFLNGTIDPSSKQPARLIGKLREVETALR